MRWSASKLTVVFPFCLLRHLRPLSSSASNDGVAHGRNGTSRDIKFKWSGGAHVVSRFPAPRRYLPTRVVPQGYARTNVAPELL